MLSPPQHDGLLLEVIISGWWWREINHLVVDRVFHDEGESTTFTPSWRAISANDVISRSLEAGGIMAKHGLLDSRHADRIPLQVVQDRVQLRSKSADVELQDLEGAGLGSL